MPGRRRRRRRRRARRGAPAHARTGPTPLLDALDDLAAGARARSTRFGVGAAGLVSTDGVWRAAPNVAGVWDFPIGDALAARLGHPVHVDNDATCATLAEWQAGAALGASDVVLVTLGTGIGGGIVSDGRLVRGANGFAGEPGHMVVDPNGPPCVCGRRGCWERTRRAPGWPAWPARRRPAGAWRGSSRLAGDAEAVRGEHVQSAAREGDHDALVVIDQWAWWVALGLVNLTNLLDPEVVVMGGGLAGAVDLVLAPVRRHFAELLYARPPPPSAHRDGGARRAGRRHRRRPAWPATLSASDRPERRQLGAAPAPRAARLSSASSRPSAGAESRCSVLDLPPGRLAALEAVRGRRLARLEHLVHVEEVLDLGQQARRQVREVERVLPAGLRRRDAQDLGVGAGLVLHPHEADGPGLDPHPGEDGVLEEHEGVERIAVLAQRVGQEAVVGRDRRWPRTGGGRGRPGPCRGRSRTCCGCHGGSRSRRGCSRRAGGFIAVHHGRVLTGPAGGAAGTVAAMEFRRITNLPPYVFTIINNLKIEARRAAWT